MPTRTPILIPAFNEASHLARTLDYLPRDVVEPIVAVNGSTDKTAEIARSFGVTVFDRQEQGKLPAIQHALRHLGNQALEPLIVLDADTYPVFPYHWNNSMMQSLHNQSQPSLVGGPVWFTNDKLKETTVRSTWRIGRAILSLRQTTAETASQLGPNMGLRIHDQQTLEKLIELPHFWPYEDKAIAQVIEDQQGSIIQSLDPLAITMTPTSESFVSLKERRHMHREDAQHLIQERYVERGAPGSMPYEQGSN